MTTFAETVAASRRLAILRLLVEIGGSANDSVLTSSVRALGFADATRDQVRADLDHLKAAGGIVDEWVTASVRVANVTERGEDIAHGRVQVEGIEHSRWRR